jgi:hypothetical protein
MSIVAQYFTGSVSSSVHPTIGATFITKTVNIDLRHFLELLVCDTTGTRCTEDRHRCFTTPRLLQSLFAIGQFVNLIVLLTLGFVNSKQMFKKTL